MNKSIMAETAQLEDFDEQLYKVAGGDGKDADEEKEKFLIATSEQPISALVFCVSRVCFWLSKSNHPMKLPSWGVVGRQGFAKVLCRSVLPFPSSSAPLLNQ